MLELLEDPFFASFFVLGAIIVAAALSLLLECAWNGLRAWWGRRYGR